MSVKAPIIVGSLLFAAIVATALPYHLRQMETDIAQRTEAALRDAGVAVRFQVEGRRVALRGRVATRELRQLAVTRVDALWGVAEVQDRIEVDPAMPPSKVAALTKRRLLAELSADRVLTLSGKAPDDGSKQRWLSWSMENFEGYRIRDRMDVVKGDGAASFAAAVDAGLAVLGALDTGRLVVSEARLRLSGRLAPGEGEEEIRDRLAATLPVGFKLAVDVYAERRVGRDGVQPRSAVRSAIARTRDDRVVVSGVVPSEETRAAWLARAAELYSAERVWDRLKVREVELPEHYESCLYGALPWVGKLASGRIEVTPNVARVNGHVRTVEDAAQLESELEAAGCELDLAGLVVP